MQIAPSCSLLHVPIDLELETGLDPDVKSWLAFSVQKIGELAVLGQALAGNGATASQTRWQLRTAAAVARKTSPKIHDASVAPAHGRNRRNDAPTQQHIRRTRQRAASAVQPARIPDHDDRLVPANRRSPQCARGARQGRDDATRNTSSSCRKRRRAPFAGRRRSASTCSSMASSSATTWCSISVSSLSGFAFTKHGWVQSYGSRYVRPPILFGDVSRPEADDGRVVALRPVADEEADEGNADRTGDHSELVVRARRYPTQPDLPADRARDPRRGHRP